MKKRLCLVCVFALLILCLAGCKKTDDKTSYNKKDLKTVQREVILALTKNQQPTFDVNEYPVSEKVVKNFKKRLDVISKDCGDIQDIGKKATFDYVSGEINVTTDLKCEKRDATVTAIFEYDADNENKITLKDISFDAKYTTGEKLAQAGSNTAIGMGTVFAVLIFIFLVISCFNLIPKIQEALGRKKKVDKTPKPFDSVKKNKGEMDDSELVAVITAAIATTEKKSTDSFVVRSIKRR